MSLNQFTALYTQRFNRRHGRVGHVFQGHYKAILVERDSYLKESARYVVLNPVRAKRVQHPGDGRGAKLEGRWSTVMRITLNPVFHPELRLLPRFVRK